MLIPKVANIEINISLSTTRLMMVLYKNHPTKYMIIGETMTPNAGGMPAVYIK